MDEKLFEQVYRHRKGSVLSLDLTILYTEAFLKELEALPGFIINGSNINMRYATVLIIYLEGTPQKLWNNALKELQRKNSILIVSGQGVKSA